MKTYAVFLYLTFLTILARSAFCQESCTDPFGVDGLCVLPEKCPRIAPLLNNKNLKRNDSILLADSFCGNIIIDGKPRFKVCCDKSTVNIEPGCIVPEIPEHGIYKINETTPIYGSKVPRQSVLKYQCDDDYIPDPSDRTYCQRNDQWIKQITCVLNMTIVPRTEWFAPPLSKISADLLLPVENIYITATNTMPCFNKAECAYLLRNYQTETMNKYYEDIMYNFVIGGDGLVYECRGWDKAVDKNQKDKIRIGIIGTFFKTNPTEYQNSALRIFKLFGVQQKKLSKDFSWSMVW